MITTKLKMLIAIINYLVEVWDVMFWKTNSSNSNNKALITSSRFTIMCRVLENANDGDVTLKLAKL